MPVRQRNTLVLLVCREFGLARVYPAAMGAAERLRASIAKVACRRTPRWPAPTGAIGPKFADRRQVEIEGPAQPRDKAVAAPNLGGIALAQRASGELHRRGVIIELTLRDELALIVIGEGVDAVEHALVATLESRPLCDRS